MDAKTLVGPQNAKKIIVCLDYIKLNDIHGDPAGTVAGFEACPLHLQSDTTSILVCCTFFLWIFSLFHYTTTYS